MIKVCHLTINVGIFPILSASLPSLIFKDAFTFIPEKDRWLVVPEQEQIDVAAVAEIGSQRLARSARILSQAIHGAHLTESAVALIVIKMALGAREIVREDKAGLGRVGVQICINGDQQIRNSNTFCIKEYSRCRKFSRNALNSGLFRDVGKGPVSVVAINGHATEAGNK